jgi:hypothetical protein|tara:strand:- start:228 stop:1058 length:831 start_codon:yes stop_codon:yes gene_type:complete
MNKYLKILKSKKDYLIREIKLFIQFNRNEEIYSKNLFSGQMDKEREKIMREKLEQQISKFKKTNQKIFLLLEIGSYMGESLKMFGNTLDKNLDNYLVISIDPYKKYASDNDIKNETAVSIISNKIEKVYFYFLNNLSKYNFRENFIHIRKNSIEGLELLIKLKLNFDFIYIDGSHYYNDIKKDYLMSKDLLKNYDGYKGLISGDDYELSTDEYDRFYKSKEDFLNFLKENTNFDYLHIKNKEGNLVGFHPGISLFFSEIKDRIIKTKSGYWYLDNN